MLPLVIAMNVTGTISIEDRTEVRGRLVQSPEVGAGGLVTSTSDPESYNNKTSMVLDLETNPVGRLRLEGRNGLDALTIAYAPRIVLANYTGQGAGQGADPKDPTTIDLIHRPLLTLEKQLAPRDRFVLNGLLQYGSTTAGTLLLPERWNGQDRPQLPRAYPVLPFAKQTFLSIYAAAGLAHQFSNTVTGQLSVFYITFGQPTKQGRIDTGGTTYLQNPGVYGEVEWRASNTDTFLFGLAPQVNLVQASPVSVTPQGEVIDANGLLPGDPNYDANKPSYSNKLVPPTYQLLLEARWRKQLERLTSIELAVGTNLLYQSIPRARVASFLGGPLAVRDGAGNETPATRVVDDPYSFLAERARPDTRFNLLPVGEAQISQGFSSGTAQGRLIAFTRADAWLNTISGEISARSSTVGAINLNFGLDALRAQLAFVQSLPLSEATTFFRQVIVEAAYEREITKEWFIDVGARAGYQDAVLVNERFLAPGQVAPHARMFQPGAFVGVAWRPLGAKF